jgi:hypothetical protein
MITIEIVNWNDRFTFWGLQQQTLKCDSPDEPPFPEAPKEDIDFMMNSFFITYKLDHEPCP